MRTALIPLLVGAALLLACGDDENPVTIPDGFAFYKNLTEREHVLDNLDLSYNKRNVTRFEELLDDNFTFFLSAGDAGYGVPDQWGRVDELAVTSLLFDPGLDDPNYPTCRSIRVDIKFEEGVEWIEVIPEDYPGERWYTTTLEYEFRFEMYPDQTYIAVSGSAAQFTVRNKGTDDAPQWRLVEWRDLGPSALAARDFSPLATWGAIKALYL